MRMSIPKRGLLQLEPVKPTIVHIIQSLDNGGCENQLLQLLPHVSDFNHTIITLMRRGELAPRFVLAGVKVESVGMKHLADIPGYDRILSRIKKIKPDLVITYLFHADTVGRLFLATRIKAPLVPFLRTTYNHRRYWAPRLFERLTKMAVPCYFANSPSVVEFYVRQYGIPKNRFTIIPNGIDFGRFGNKSEVRGRVRKQMLVNESTQVVICVANLHPNKGQSLLVEAFEKSHELDGAELWLVGDGVMRESLEQARNKSRAKDRIRLLGARRDVPDLLMASDIFALPTFFEGMSNAVLEAMAAELPLVLSDIPENRAITDSAQFVAPLDVFEFVDVLAKLQKDPSRRRLLGRLARAECEKKFSITNSAKVFTSYCHRYIDNVT